MKILQTGRKHCGKGEIACMSNFSFSHSVFKRFVQKTCKNQGLFGKGLKESHIFLVISEPLSEDSFNFMVFGKEFKSNFYFIFHISVDENNYSVEMIIVVYCNIITTGRYQ